MPAGRQATWRDPRILLVLFLVFLCGACAGALGMRYGFLPKSPESYWFERGKEISLNRFERELELTAEQSREIKMILDDFVQYYHTLQSQMDEMRADGKLRILSVLNEEQKRKFELMLSGIGSRTLQ